VNDPLETPDAPLNWNPAAVELPQIPMLPPGEDAMSATISAVLPTLTAPLAASVASLSAKENMFRGKLGAAESQYQNADGSGQESLGQLTSMLGQVGQMGQQAGKAGEALSGQTGMFGSLMEQAMKGAQGGGGQSSGGQSSGGQSSGGQGGAAGAAGSPAAGGQPPQQARDDAAVAEHEQPEQRQESQRDEREPLQRAETDDRDKADGAEGNRPGAGQAPVAPPERHRGDDDLSRRM
jgi:hypothetical protein